MHARDSQNWCVSERQPWLFEKLGLGFLWTCWCLETSASFHNRDGVLGMGYGSISKLLITGLLCSTIDLKCAGEPFWAAITIVYH